MKLRSVHLMSFPLKMRTALPNSAACIETVMNASKPPVFVMLSDGLNPKNWFNHRKQLAAFIKSFHLFWLLLILEFHIGFLHIVYGHLSQCSALCTLCKNKFILNWIVLYCICPVWLIIYVQCFRWPNGKEISRFWISETEMH